MERRFESGAVLRLAVGDITRIPVDAMANAANSALRGGGGVDGAIHRAGGPAIMRELDQIRAQTGHCETGKAVATMAGALPARYVFHAVGPVYHDGKSGEPGLLESCYRTCLALAEERELASISFPSISTGVYGYPMEEAARIALRTIVGHLNDRRSRLREVTCVLFDHAAYDIYVRVLSDL